MDQVQCLDDAGVAAARVLYEWGLTLFGRGCYSREVPFGRGFAQRPTAGIVRARSQDEPTTT